MSPHFKDYKTEAVAYRQQWIDSLRAKRAKSRDREFATRLERVLFLILVCYCFLNLSYWWYTGRVLFHVGG